MDKIVECVPNFSEGRRKDIIDKISNAISSTNGCVLLDVDPGVSTNRTVYTFVGPPKAVIQGAMAAARIAYHLIDMQVQTGEHPRIGAMDVCPFIPVKNVSMAECVELSKEFAKLLSSELNVPVYLYAESQPNKNRSELPDIRKGEYEALPDKILSPDMQPDFGPSNFVPSWGATCVGAREFLIAYNINILGTKEQAHRIALNIREQGRSEKDPGRLKAVRAIGWWLDEANMAQISINLINFKISNMHDVYEEAYRDAVDLKLGLCGSQLVGLLPLQAMLDVADFYIKKEGLLVLEEDQKIKLVVQRLGLNSLGQFNPKERIIEYIIQEREGSHVNPYLNMSVHSFIKAVGSRTVTPGGGCVAALVASLGSSLVCMASLLSYGNRKFENVDGQIREVLPSLYNTYNQLALLIDQDANAFNSYMSARKMPESNEDEKSKKYDALDAALIDCVTVPFNVAKTAVNVWKDLFKLIPIFNIEAKSDFLVGAKCLEAGIYGAYLNVLTNLSSFNDRIRCKADAYRHEISKIQAESKANCEQVLKLVEERSQ